ncbi:MAG: hypothetical protein AAGI45_21680 [Cyanobacteria bacterium P01_H01_bin.26]
MTKVSRYSIGGLIDLAYEDAWWDTDGWDGPVEAGAMAKPYAAYVVAVLSKQLKKF